MKRSLVNLQEFIFPAHGHEQTVDSSISRVRPLE